MAGSPPLVSHHAAGPLEDWLPVGIGALGALVAFRSSIAASDAGDTDDEPRGETLEWAFASPAHADRVPESLPAVTSPYPLGDESSASGDGEVA
jgi:hypothetical protein